MSAAGLGGLLIRCVDTITPGAKLLRPSSSETAGYAPIAVVRPQPRTTWCPSRKVAAMNGPTWWRLAARAIQAKATGPNPHAEAMTTRPHLTGNPSQAQRLGFRRVDS